ncbi:hypothetical protein C8D82_1615 [Victivallis vadensis]|uniref:Uncharacterized protein n=1 Tax=Victivallis vadensis TaxID=172901 RepID=A0A2U1AAK5_9BACT|nr:hypothetical protein C8D82_1615 [Victivallis vadensis]
MRMAPEGLFQSLPACGVHDRPSGPPVDLRSTSIRGRGFAAYLPGCARQLLNVRCAHYAGGASLSTFGFVTIVPRYLPKASNSLTFVRGACRAYCTPRKRLCKPTNACLYQPPRDLEGRRARTRQRHLAARLTYLLLWDYTLSGLIESRFFSSPAICTIEDTLRWWVPTPSIRSQSVQEAKYAT